MAKVNLVYKLDKLDKFMTEKAKNEALLLEMRQYEEKHGKPINMLNPKNWKKYHKVDKNIRYYNRKIDHF